MPKIPELLNDLVQTAHYVAEQGPIPGASNLAINAQIRGLALAEQLGTLSRIIAEQHNQALCAGVPHGEMLEATDSAAVMQVKYAPTFKAWKQDELRAAVRPALLFHTKRDGTPSKKPRNAAQVLEQLWHPETGLQPLNGNQMRTGQFRKRGFDPDEFATRTDGEKASFVSGRDSVTIDLTKAA